MRTNKIQEFEEKPAASKEQSGVHGNLHIQLEGTEGSADCKCRESEDCDFGKHVIPYCLEKGQRLFAYEYNGYWKDVGTLGSYWEANMELIDTDSGIQSV